MVDGFDAPRQPDRPIRFGLDNTSHGKQYQDAAGVAKSQALSEFTLIFSTGQKPAASFKAATLGS